MQILLSIFIIFSILSCQKSNLPPKLLVISIDGYRWDYTEKYKPPFMTKFKKSGSSMESLIPSFPTKTFPNHLSIMTGSYPKNHGIVANTFYAPDLHQTYSLKKSETVSNGDFYQRLPFWTVLEMQGIKTATYFWPGSEAKIQNTLPTSYKVYNTTDTHEQKVKQILDWTKSKDKDAPRFMTLYFSDVDTAGHTFGPESEQVQEAIVKVDSTLNKLVSALEKENQNLSIIILSDHGMTERVDNKIEKLFKEENSYIHSLYYIEGKGPIVSLNKKENIVTNTQNDIESINKLAKNFKCYSNFNTPKELNFSHSSRIGDIVCIAEAKTNIIIDDSTHLPNGNHGWSALELKDMHGIFYVKGPRLKSNYVHPSTLNIHLFPLFANIMEVPFSNQVDSEFENVMGLLKN